MRKLFNTCEGGACFSKYPELLEKIRRILFWKFNDSKEIVDIGMNLKMTEISAALGLDNLKYLPEVETTRRFKYELHIKELSVCKYISLQKFNLE